MEYQLWWNSMMTDTSFFLTIKFIDFLLPIHTIKMFILLNTRSYAYL